MGQQEDTALDGGRVEQKEADVKKPIDEWLSLVAKARGALRTDVYQEWHFIVGSSGTLEERIELGTEALKMLWLQPGTGYKDRTSPEQKKGYWFNNVVNTKLNSSIVDDFRAMQMWVGG